MFVGELFVTVSYLSQISNDHYQLPSVWFSHTLKGLNFSRQISKYRMVIIYIFIFCEAYLVELLCHSLCHKDKDLTEMCFFNFFLKGMERKEISSVNSDKSSRITITLF